MIGNKINRRRTKKESRSRSEPSARGSEPVMPADTRWNEVKACRLQILSGKLPASCAANWT